MKCFSTEPLYARSTLSSTEHQKNSLKSNFTSYACYRDTSSGSGNPKAGEGRSWESFKNPHSILTLRGSYTPTLSQAAFLNHAGVCSAKDCSTHSFLTKATHKNQSEMNCAFLKWQGFKNQHVLLCTSPCSSLHFICTLVSVLR